MARRRALDIDAHMKQTLQMEVFPGTPVLLYLNDTTALYFFLYTSSLQFKKQLRKSIQQHPPSIWEIMEQDLHRHKKCGCQQRGEGRLGLSSCLVHISGLLRARTGEALMASPYVEAPLRTGITLSLQDVLQSPCETRRFSKAITAE